MSSPAVADAPRAEATPAAAPTRPSLAWLVAIPLALHAILAWLVRRPTITAGNDDAVYLLLARALREGHYRELFYVGTPVHSQYPPGYPGLLALLGAPADGDIGLAVAANIVLSCAALFLVFDVMRRWSLPLALAGTAVLSVNPALIEMSSRVQSEPMFMAFVALALWALRPSAPPSHRWLAILALVFATLTRSAGLAVIGGVMAYFLWDRAWRHALALALATALIVGPWLTWTIVAPEKVQGRSYIADALAGVPIDAGVRSAAPPPDTTALTRAEALARTIGLRVRNKVPHYTTRALPSELAIPTVEGTPVDNLVWLVLMIGAGLAGAVAAWKRWPVVLWVLLAYGALLIVWPWTVNRFLVPLLPPFVALLLLGAWRLGVRFLPRAALVPALVTAAIPLAGGARQAGAMVSARAECPESDRRPDGDCSVELPRYREALALLDERLPADARVFTTKEGTLYYLIRRPVVSLYPADRLPAPDLERYLDEHAATFIFLPHMKPEEIHFADPLAELCTRLTDAGSPYDEFLMLWYRPPSPSESNGCEAIERWRQTW